MLDILGSLLVSLGLLQPYHGDCVRWESRPNIIKCTYHQQDALDDATIAALGVRYSLGPWADLTEDLIHPALITLATGRTVIINAEIGGPSALVNISLPGSLVANSSIIGTNDGVAISIKEQ